MNLAFGLLAAAWAAAASTAPAAGGLVDLESVVPGIRLDIRYATPNNFAKAKVYPSAVCLLQRKVAAALARAQAELEEQNLELKVFDCYRPLSVQKKFWALVPDERYVADPRKGSRHNRGYAVDVTLTGFNGVELPMPSDYDDFSERAHRGRPTEPERARNSALLEAALKKQGFTGLPTEWWHFDFPGWESAPNLDVPLPYRVRFHEDGTGEYKSLAEALAACEGDAKIVVKRTPYPNIVAGSPDSGVFPCRTAWQKVEVAWRLDDFALVWKLIAPLAESGNKRARERVAWMKSIGYGTAPERSVRLTVLRKEAEKGTCEALEDLGNFNRSQDMEEAVSWFRRAADRGCASLFWTLAKIYRDGDGVKPDAAAALDWFSKAAKDLPEADFQMGLMHERGEGIEKNLRKAFEHYRRAALNGNADGMHSLGRAYERGLGVKPDRQQTLYWYRKAAEHGHDSAPADIQRLRDAVER